MTNTLSFTIFLLCLLCLKYIFFFFLIPQAASTPLNPLSFQCEFVKLRIDLLQAFSQLICTCNSLKTSPPPAIATTIAMTLGNDLQRCGRISNQACLNCIFSSVFIYTLEVFEVSCEIKKIVKFRNQWFDSQATANAYKLICLAKHKLWKLIKMTEWLMIPHSVLYIYIKRKDIHFKETLGCSQLLFILVELWRS